MNRIKAILIFLSISPCFCLSGAVRHYSIDSLPGLFAVDLDSNKIVFTGRAQYCHPYDSQSTCFDSSFNADFVFSFGNLDPSCSGQTFLTYFPSYQVPDIGNIDTSKLVKIPRIDSILNENGPFYEINVFFSNSSFIPNDYLNKLYLVKTNKNNFALFRINALILSNFDGELLCYPVHAIKIEWWIQNDGKFDQLSQMVNIAPKKCNKNIYNLNMNYNGQSVFDFMGRESSMNTEGIFIVRKNNSIYKKFNLSNLKNKEEKEYRLEIH